MPTVSVASAVVTSNIRWKSSDSPAVNRAKMQPEEPTEAESPRSSSSSFEKTPRGPQDYPLETLDNGSDSQFVTIPRGSCDSGRFEEHGREPLLPTSVHSPRPDLKPREPFSCTISGIIAWAKGPSPPYKYQITPLLRRWQVAPVRLVDRYCPSKRAKVLLLLSVVTTWFVVFLSFIHSSINGVNAPGYGKPAKLGCHSSLW